MTISVPHVSVSSDGSIWVEVFYVMDSTADQVVSVSSDGSIWVEAALGYGGNQRSFTVSVSSDGSIWVEDDGPRYWLAFTVVSVSSDGSIWVEADLVALPSFQLPCFSIL